MTTSESLPTVVRPIVRRSTIVIKPSFSSHDGDITSIARSKLGWPELTVPSLDLLEPRDICEALDQWHKCS